MMASADIALRKAIRDVLLADAALVDLLGGPRVYDAPPRNAQKPCVIFARSRSRADSTGKAASCCARSAAAPPLQQP